MANKNPKPRAQNNKDKQIIRDIVLGISKKLKRGDLDGIEQVLRAQFDKAIGVIVTDPENPQRVYTAEPDTNAAKVVLGYAHGAIPESIKLDPDSKAIVGFLIPKFQNPNKENK